MGFDKRTKLGKVVSADTGIGRAVVEEVIENALRNIYLITLEQSRFTLRGFGTFFIRERGGHEYYNVNTKQMEWKEKYDAFTFKDSDSIEPK